MPLGQIVMDFEFREGTNTSDYRRTLNIIQPTSVSGAAIRNSRDSILCQRQTL